MHDLDLPTYLMRAWSLIPRRHGFREHFPADVRLVDGGQHVLVAGIDADSPAARKLDITTYLYNQICGSMALYDNQLSVVECAQLRLYIFKSMHELIKTL